MTVFDRIKLLAKERGKSLNRIEEELGLPKNVLYRMKTSDNPTKDRLETLANYFDVSVDYLLGRTDNTKVTDEKKSDDLDDVLDNVMSFDGEPLDDHDREVIRAYLKGRFGK
ncbi:helix-turn-helix domain-containing protein [Enterococcus faecalis]